MLDFQIIQNLAEFFPVFRKVNIFRRSAENFASRVFKRFRQLQRCLTSELDNNSIRFFGVHHIHYILESQRLEEEFVRCIVIGAYRFRITVYHRNLESLFPQCHYGMHAAVIEFYPLPYPVRTAAENNNFFLVTRFEFIFFFISGVHVRSIRAELRRAGIDRFVDG